MGTPMFLDREAQTVSSRTFCPACGTRLTTRSVEGRDRAFCPDCEAPVYRNPKPCAGVLVVDGRDLLLVRRTEPPDVGAWSAPAGYLEWDEPPAACAVRELHEETGLRVDSDAVELFDTVFVHHPDGQTVLVVLYVVPVDATRGTVRAGSDAGAARFWDVETLVDAETESVEAGYEYVLRNAVGGGPC